MYCPYCGHLLEDGANFCSDCGKCLTSSEVTEECKTISDEAPPVPSSDDVLNETDLFRPVPQKKRRGWLVPTVILCSLFLLGIFCFALLPKGSDLPPETTEPIIQNEESTPTAPSGPTIPGGDKSPSGLRDEHFIPTGDHCFRMEGDTIFFRPEKYDGNPILVIPNEINGVSVTTIGEGAFAGLEGVTTIILPDQIQTIGAGAFENCTDLRGIYFPRSTKSIGERAFAGCTALESVSIFHTMESIGTGAFSGCAGLRYIFYTGTFEKWVTLYNEYVSPFTYACCSDGDYYHGVKLS